MPLHLAAVATASRSFAGTPILGSDRLNRWGLHARRGAVAQRLAAWRRGWLAEGLPTEDLEAFARDGILVKPDFLPTARSTAATTNRRPSCTATPSIPA